MHRINCNSFGRIHYITGGTTGTPKLIPYKNSRWSRSVAVTAEVLSAHGVSRGDRVVVAQPCAPWAIGQVFSEAALACDADVYPLGLSLNSPTFLTFLHDVRPNYICGTSRNLIRWHRNLRTKMPSGNVRGLFTAGEKLLLEQRRLCERLWKAKVTDIYGLAEFDTIAAEAPNEGGLILAPHFDYKLINDGVRCDFAIGTEGGLYIRERNSKAEWFNTNDLVKVLDRTNSNSFWPNSWKLEIIGRREQSAILSDGTVLRLSHINELQRQFSSVRQIQVHVVKSGDYDVIKLLIVPKFKKRIDPAKIVDRLISLNVDLEDSIRHGIVSSITPKIVSEEELIQTERGKTPVFLEI